MGHDLTDIAERLDRVRGELPSGVTLVAISKTQPPAAIRAAYAAGQRDFGENYAQEWREKAKALADLPDLCWHFVGGLQTNKAKYLVTGSGAPRVGWIHAVDRLALAEELSRRCVRAGVSTRVLIEVNVAGEETKSGCSTADAVGLAAQLARLPGLELRGLMCIPPAEGDPRPHFAALRSLRDGLRETGLSLPDLSMGMSSDYQAAISEGATLVRVGTALFGPRRPL